MNTAITDATLSSDTIFATPVADEQRPCFWPQHFGTIPQWILLEPRIFARMDRFCAGLQRGYLEFYTLSNGGAFMTPCTDGDAQWQLFNSMNGNDAQMRQRQPELPSALSSTVITPAVPGAMP